MAIVAASKERVNLKMPPKICSRQNFETRHIDGLLNDSTPAFKDYKIMKYKV